MTRILLINPPMSPEEIYAHYGKSAPILAPLGICYIAAVLEQNNYEVAIIDCVAEGLSFKQLEQRIRRFKPDTAGITATTVMFHNAIKTASLIRSISKDIINVLGGNHISSIPAVTIKNNPIFDIGIFGEGEFTMLELVRLIEKEKKYKKKLKKVKGIVFREKNKIRINQPRGPIKDLDILPFPARHLLPDIRLYSTNLSIGQKPPLAHIIPSRGCPFRCIYCDQNVFGHKWRHFSSGYVIRELEHLIKKYGVKTIQFQDDLFTFDKKRVEEVCNAIIEKKWDIEWNLSSRVNLISEELGRRMYKAGCRIIYFGIESGDQNVLNFIKKGTTIEQIKKGIASVKKAGLIPHGSFIIGLPTDTRKTIERTIKLALELPLEAVTFHIATPYPNTEFEKIAPKYGTVISQNWSQYRSHPDKIVFTPKGLTNKYLLKKQEEAYRRFYLRWRIIRNRIKELKHLEKIKIYINGLRAVLHI